MEKFLPDTAERVGDHLVIGGCDVVALAEALGTPVIVVDRRTIEARARSYASVLGPTHVFYAAKAFCCVAIIELLAQLDLGLDVCTGGELATASAAGFPAERIVFHGNNKSLAELEMAQAAGVGRVVIDSFDEIERIEKVGLQTKLLVRVTPGVEAHTHEFVQTGQEDSKFGFTLGDGTAVAALDRALRLDGCEVVGLHAHIGSQIFELGAFDLVVERLAGLLEQARNQLDYEAKELNLGGGLGIAHTRDELAPDVAETARHIRDVVRRRFEERGLRVPSVSLEPGRSMVGSAAVTVYEVGTVKRIPGVRTYVAVDGGMSDNPRYALYGARYEALLANRMAAAPGPRVTVAGKHCESGDVLIRDVHVPEDVRPGDLLCIPATGAYTYSMASNYNRVPRPAVVMVQDGQMIEVVKRESYDDMLALDRRLDGSDL